MPASLNPLTSNHDGNDMIELESDNCCPAAGGPSNDACSVLAPLEVSGPALASGIKEPCASVRSGITGACLGCLEPVAHPTGEPQIIFRISPAAGFWENMVNFQLPKNVLLRTLTIAAPVPSLRPDAVSHGS